MRISSPPPLALLRRPEQMVTNLFLQRLAAQRSAPTDLTVGAAGRTEGLEPIRHNGGLRLDIRV